MIKLTLKDGSVREIESPMSAAEIAKSIGAGLYKAACACTVDGEACDLRTVIDRDCTTAFSKFSTFDSEERKACLLAYHLPHTWPRR